eukprot:TRINITY_DN4912_c0_g2_i1.p1 TRINITY_DN4912_c0_g2~~TRINITY_DN4912_c0_g2_i1.p1  ORF type:complete len:543 (-),score=77.88 TRINITY_DN4912_c0_g2_i1:1555-3183(-)
MATHTFRETQLYTPTLCDACRELIWGLVKQGLKCTACELILHKKCRSKIANTPHEVCRCTKTVATIHRFEAKRCDFAKLPTAFEVDLAAGVLAVSTPGINRSTRRHYRMGETWALLSHSTPGKVVLHCKRKTCEFLFSSVAEAEAFCRLFGDRSAQRSELRAPLTRLPSSCATTLASLGTEAQRVAQRLEECWRRGILDDKQLEERRNRIAAASPRPTVSLQTDSLPPTVPCEAFSLSEPAQTVTRLWFDMATKTWHDQQIEVRLASRPFAEGSIRVAYRLLDLSRQPGQQACVAKLWKPDFLPADNPDGGYFADVEMQAHCQAVALAFNSRNPPKKVSFLEAYLIRRPTEPRLLAVEPFISGDYIKHSNNFGYVPFDTRNTPQAFSHFSYEYFQRRMIIVDIQGVGDVYTDPQIHSEAQSAFGLGNCGREGIEKFFASHRCNSICGYLGLTQAPVVAGGTVVRHPGATRTPGVGFRASSHIRPLRPVRGSAGPEERAFLDITMEEFDALCDKFNEFDTDGSGEIDVTELLPLIEGASTTEN